MKFSKIMVWTALAAGIMVTGAQAKAEEGPWAEHREQRSDLRRDYARANAQRYDIAADRARLNEDLRCGRFEAAEQDLRDIARDQAGLNAQYHDIRHDRREYFEDRFDRR